MCKYINMFSVRLMCSLERNVRPGVQVSNGRSTDDDRKGVEIYTRKRESEKKKLVKSETINDIIV